MKILYALSVLPFTGIAYFAAAPDTAPPVSATTEAPKLTATQNYAVLDSIDTSAIREETDETSASALTADDVRQIIRQELTAAVNSCVSETALQKSPQEIAEQHRSVNRQIDFLIANGAANERDLATLQMAAAKLPQNERQAAMNRLTRAMNAGDIDARF